MLWTQTLNRMGAQPCVFNIRGERIILVGSRRASPCGSRSYVQVLVVQRVAGEKSQNPCVSTDQREGEVSDLRSTGMV